MALIDQPHKWIIKMFKFYEREMGGENALYFEEGVIIDELNLLVGEYVYGKFETEANTYFFTPLRLCMLKQKQTNIFWKEVVRCNGYFRSSHKIVKIDTDKGQTICVSIIV